jgi:hypothetical protein
MAAHSEFSASKGDQWMICPGSIRLSRGRPNKSGEYAAEGTAAHQLADWCLTEKKDAAAFLGRVIEVKKDDGQGKPFTFTVDDDMAGFVQTYVDQVREYATDADMLLPERQVNYAAYLGLDRDQAFGTSDAIIVNMQRKLLSIHDLKYGRGNEVDAVENRQMRLYALGAYGELLELGVEEGDIERVLMVIHQPRISSKPKEWEITLAELLHWGEQEARVAAEQVLDSILEYPAPDWHERFTKADPAACKYCLAKADCPTLRATVTNAVFDVVPATPEDFADMSLNTSPCTAPTDRGEEWLASSLSKVDLIEDWCKAIRGEVESRLLAGGAVPGYKLVQGKKGNRTWANAGEVEQLLKTFRLKVEEMYDLKLISPPSAEKLAKAGAIGKRQWPKLQSLITQSDGKLHVAPESDPREAINVTPVDEEFEALAPAAETVDDLA